MTHHHRALAVVLAAAIATPAMARAQPATPPPPPVDPDVAARAQALYEEGDRHFNVAEYPQAIEKFKAAFKLVPDPLFLYNIAQAYRKHGDCASARTFYQNYLRAAPTATNRERVQQRIVEMEACAPTRPTTEVTTRPGTDVVAKPRPPTTARPPDGPARVDGAVEARSPARPGRALRIAGLGVVAGGVAALGAGALFANAAAGHASELERLCQDPGCARNPTAIAADRDGQRAARNEGIAFAAGGGLVLAGAALYWWGRRQGETAHAVVIVPAPRGGSVTATWRF